MKRLKKKTKKLIVNENKESSLVDKYIEVVDEDLYNFIYALSEALDRTQVDKATSLANSIMSIMHKVGVQASNRQRPSILLGILWHYKLINADELSLALKNVNSGTFDKGSSERTVKVDKPVMNPSGDLPKLVGRNLIKKTDYESSPGVIKDLTLLFGTDAMSKMRQI